MIKTIVDLENNNWELLRKKIKEGTKISIKIPKNIDEYKYKYTGSTRYEPNGKTKEEKIYDLDKDPKITLLNIDNQKPKLPLLYKRSHGINDLFYIEIDNIDGTKWVKMRHFNPLYNEFFTDGCYKAEDIIVIFTYYKPTEKDKEISKTFLKSLDEFMEEVKSQPYGETNYPFSSEYYLASKERNKTLFRKSPSPGSKKTTSSKKSPSSKKTKTSYKIHKTLKKKHKSYKKK